MRYTIINIADIKTPCNRIDCLFQQVYTTTFYKVFFRKNLFVLTILSDELSHSIGKCETLHQSDNSYVQFL